MNYHLNLRSRPSGDDPSMSKHPQFLKTLGTLRGNWSVQLNKAGKLRGSFELYFCSITRALPKGVVGRVIYHNPVVKADDIGMDDDYFVMDFDPYKAGFTELVDDVLPLLIETFSAYLAELTDDDNYIKGPKVDCHREVGRLGIANFFDKLLCQRAFGMTPAAVAKVLKPHVEVAKTLHGGVYIVMSREPMSARKISEQGKMLRNLLPNSPFKK